MARSPTHRTWTSMAPTRSCTRPPTHACLSNGEATVTITVTPVNDDPLAFDDTITILEDALTTLPGSTFWSNDWKHLRNNANESGQTLTLVNAQIISPTGGSVSVNNDTLVYTPLAHYNNAINGPAKVLLTVRDGGVAGATGDERISTSTLTINITPLNDPARIHHAGHACDHGRCWPCHSE